MIVCLCEGVTDREIKDHLGSGASTVREVGRRCGAGTDCGMCRCDIRDMLRHRGRKAHHACATQVLSK